MITSSDGLKQFAELLGSLRSIAVDTESNSMFVYREQVCLLQITIPGSDVLIDTLAVDDLSPLAPVFDDPAVEKVFHAAEYDLICLKRDFGFSFTNIFDTMIAARILGYTEIGLGAILENEFGVKLDKRFQKNDWGKRPLNLEQMEYARMDTHYLYALRMRVFEQLEDRNLLDLAKEDFKRVTRVEIPETSRDAAVWKVAGLRDLNPVELTVFISLFRAREVQAERWNLPPFKIISTEKLIEASVAQSPTANALESDLNLSQKQMFRHAEWMVKAILKGLNDPPVHPPTAPRGNPALRKKMDAVREWRKQAAGKMGVESDVILPRDLMVSLVTEHPLSKQEFIDKMALFPYRYHRFGNELFQLLQS